MKREDRKLEDFTKKQYNRFGKEYQQSREGKKPERAFNEYIEVPNMFAAVKKIKGKKLLDIGCGAGVHLKEYIRRGAICSGMDISKTMIDLARKNCPMADLKVGSMTSMPYKDSSFDIITGSLCLSYFRDISPVFKEVSRVLRKGGLFYFSESAIIARRRSRYENEHFSIRGIGQVTDKITGKEIFVGNPEEKKVVWEMVPGMKLTTYERSFREQLRAIVDNNLELIDIIDCYPVKEFKKQNQEDYEFYSKLPIFSIMICRKKWMK